MHLLDTDVVWALAGGLEQDAPVAAWAASTARTGLFVSALTLAELGTGAARLEKRDKAAATAIRNWLSGQVVAAFDSRVLAVDAAVARRAPGLGLPTLRDGLLAATALEHGLTLATREPATFKPSRVRTWDPWRYSADVEDAGDWREATRGGPLWLKNLFVRG
jgi:toxin FitB